jgi:hypothetical protein
MLNRRLPGITARDVLPIVQFRGYSFASRVDRPNTRRNVLGSRLFKEISGHGRAETNPTGSLRHVPKRLPSRPRTRYHFLYGKNLPHIVTFTRSPLGSSTFSTSIVKSIALMIPSPNFS